MAALVRYRRDADMRQQRLLSLEKVRLLRMLEQFVHAERKRGEFRVEALEQELSIRRYGVELELRADRIDRLADGSLLVIDYKTGATKNILTRDGEVAELQLVVYACAVDEPVGGLALFNVDSRAIVCKAVGGGVEWDADRWGEWDQQLSRWKTQVDVAIRQLAAGDVRVNLRRAASDHRALSLLSRFGDACELWQT